MRRLERELRVLRTAVSAQDHEWSANALVLGGRSPGRGYGGASGALEASLARHDPPLSASE